MTDKQRVCCQVSFVFLEYRHKQDLSFGLDMSDLTENLLAQYYGFSAEPKIEKFLSIHECASNAENDADKLIGNQSTIDTNGDDTSKETKVQVRH